MYVYDVFYGEKNGIRCACANSVYQALSPLCGRGLDTKLVERSDDDGGQGEGRVSEIATSMWW